jgi:hypothetical protein
VEPADPRKIIIGTRARQHGFLNGLDHQSQGTHRMTNQNNDQHKNPATQQQPKSSPQAGQQQGQHGQQGQSAQDQSGEANRGSNPDKNNLNKDQNKGR